MLKHLCCKFWGCSGVAVHCAACRAGMLAHKSLTTYLRLCRAGRRAARAHCLQPRPAACASSKGQPRPSVCHTERQTLARLRVGTELSWELGVAVHIQGFEHPLWQLNISQAQNSLAEDGALRLLVMLKLALKDITHLRSVTGMAGAKARQRAASASLGPAAVSEWQPGSPRCLGFEPW